MVIKPQEKRKKEEGKKNDLQNKRKTEEGNREQYLITLGEEEC